MTEVERPEKDAAPETLSFWQCPNCGQIHFSSEPPDMCAFCGDFTTWRLLPRAELRVFSKIVADGDAVRYVQLPLPLVFYDE